jgi:hypothetical protein
VFAGREIDKKGRPHDRHRPRGAVGRPCSAATVSRNLMTASLP